MKIQRAEVLFPTCGPSARMNRVRVTAYPDRHNGIRSCPWADKVKAVKKIIGYSRDDEGIETIDIDVVVQFDEDDFDGDSFGLALALADKRARFCSVDGPVAICATGAIHNKGRVGPIDCLQSKVKLALETLNPGSIFLIPDQDRLEESKSLAQLQLQGVQVVAATSLTELRWLWSSLQRPSSTAYFDAFRWSTASFWLCNGMAFGFLTAVGIAYASLTVLRYF